MDNNNNNDDAQEAAARLLLGGTPQGVVIAISDDGINLQSLGKKASMSHSLGLTVMSLLAAILEGRQELAEEIVAMSVKFYSENGVELKADAEEEEEGVSHE